jgi:hypothetical protein
MSTPGWAHVVQRAQRRIEAAKLAALANTDEAKFLELYRAAHAAHNALMEFTDSLTAEIGD